MKRIISYLTVILMAGNLQAQQTGVSGFYAMNPYQANPAFTGYLTDLSGYLIAGAPLSFNTSDRRNYQAGMAQSLESRNIGIGLRLGFDQRDFFEAVNLDGTFAYYLSFNKRYVLSAGMSLGFVNRSYDTDRLNSFVDLTDPTLASDYYFESNLRMGFGIAFYSDRWEAGISTPSLVEGGESLNEMVNIYVAYRHYFNNNFWFVKPSMLLTHLQDRTTETLINVMIQKKGKFYGQTGYSTSNDLLLSMGVFFRQMTLSYLFRENFSKGGAPFRPMNEIGIHFQLGNSRMRRAHIGSELNRR
ncbi:MAG: PorP/SprF family type IX secretion system membrane protein [Cyclobacteriaceae bacterium]